MRKTLTFSQPQALPLGGKTVVEYVCRYTIVDSDLIGKPDEQARTQQKLIKVGVTFSLHGCWGLEDKNDFIKVIFEYGRRHVVQKLRDGTLADEEELLLHTENVELPLPYDPARIEEPEGAVVEVELGESRLMENPELLELAGSIIDTRDNINAVFDHLHGGQLLLIVQERDLLQFFREADSAEEFSYRVCGLANIVGSMNAGLLRQLTGIADPQKRSIKLVEEYLSQHGAEPAEIVAVLKHLNRLRQGYPVHGDRADGVLEAHEFFQLPYPVEDWRGAWRTLLLNYLDALKKLLDALRDVVVPTETEDEGSAQHL